MPTRAAPRQKSVSAGRTGTEDKLIQAAAGEFNEHGFSALALLIRQLRGQS